MYQICHVQQSTLASILVLEIYKAKKQLLILKIKVSGKQNILNIETFIPYAVKLSTCSHLKNFGILFLLS
jgi:hypothetical protein